MGLEDTLEDTQEDTEIQERRDPVKPSQLPTSFPTQIFLSPPFLTSSDYDMVCECLDPFETIAPSDYLVKNKKYGNVDVWERRVTVDGVTYSDAVFLNLGSSSFEVSVD